MVVLEASPGSSHLLLSSLSVENSILGRAHENMHHFDFGLADLCPLSGLSEHRGRSAEAALALCVALAGDEKESAAARGRAGLL